jgi:hypothetical protein
VGGCAGSVDGQDAGPVADVAETRSDAAAESVTPVHPEAAARAFRLYYRERVERAVVARTGQAFEVVVGPNDSNAIGVSVWNTWMAYRVFGSRTLALSLVRMFDGLARP